MGNPGRSFNELNKEFSFTLDPCATDQNHKCKKYFTIEDDGLSKSWQNEVVFCNPPYSTIKFWVEKCAQEASQNGAIVVLLIPARTIQNTFMSLYIINVR